MCVCGFKHALTVLFRRLKFRFQVEKAYGSRLISEKDKTYEKEVKLLTLLLTDPATGSRLSLLQQSQQDKAHSIIWIFCIVFLILFDFIDFLSL